MNVVALHAELSDDPVRLGYAALVAKGDHAGIAALLNHANRPGKRAVVEARLLRRLIAGSWSALDAEARGLATFLAAAGFDLDPSDPDDAALIASFAGAKAPLVSDGLVSRAEELFGPGARVRHEDVAAAGMKAEAD